MLRITLQSTPVDVERDDVEAEHVQRCCDPGPLKSPPSAVLAKYPRATYNFDGERKVRTQVFIHSDIASSSSPYLAARNPFIVFH